MTRQEVDGKRLVRGSQFKIATSPCCRRNGHLKICTRRFAILHAQRLLPKPPMLLTHRWR